LLKKKLVKILVKSYDKRYIKLETRLASFARRVLWFLNKKDKNLFVFLITQKESLRLNKEYRKIDKVASVLSFEKKEDFPGDKELLGEIYITPSVLKSKGYTLQLVTVHGILHLLGFNHEKLKETSLMENLEAEVLRRVDF